MAGDLTKAGEIEEARVLAAGLQALETQIVAVLGNHDHDADRPGQTAEVLRDVGVVVLEDNAVQVDTPRGSVGVAGVKGFGGGFAGANGTEFGEPEMKAFVRHSRERADALEGGCDLAVHGHHIGGPSKASQQAGSPCGTWRRRCSGRDTRSTRSAATSRWACASTPSALGPVIPTILGSETSVDRRD